MKKTLVIDDSHVIRQQVEFALKRVSIEVLEAENGKQGLEVIETKRDEIGCIFLDYHMPELNGRQTLEELYKDERNHEIPIYMLTTEHTQQKIADCKQFGVKGWIVKPFDPARLAMLVKAHFSNS
ncbi:MAG: response regulator [Oligoflexales bacterium]